MLNHPKRHICRSRIYFSEKHEYSLVHGPSSLTQSLNAPAEQRDKPTSLFVKFATMLLMIPTSPFYRWSLIYKPLHLTELKRYFRQSKYVTQ